MSHDAICQDQKKIASRTGPRMAVDRVIRVVDIPVLTIICLFDVVQYPVITKNRIKRAVFVLLSYCKK